MIDASRTSPVSLRQHFTLRLAGRSDLGRERDNNEDRFVAIEGGHSGVGAVLCVADGMGGHPAGEEASAIIAGCVERYAKALKKNDPTLLETQIEATAELLEAALTEAHEAIIALGEAEPEKQGLGSTVVALQILGDVLRVLHCGDSRAYLLRGETLQQLTEDHIVQENGIRYLAAHVGLTAGFGLETDELMLQGGERLLVCSDGLTDMLPPEVFGMALHQAPDPEQAVLTLIEMANLAGGHDNVTCVVGFVEAPDPT